MIETKNYRIYDNTNDHGCFTFVCKHDTKDRGDVYILDSDVDDVDYNDLLPDEVAEYLRSVGVSVCGF